MQPRDDASQDPRTNHATQTRAACDDCCESPRPLRAGRSPHRDVDVQMSARDRLWSPSDARAACASPDFDRIVLDEIADWPALPAVFVDVGEDPCDDVASALTSLPVVAVAVGEGGDSWDLTVEDPEPIHRGLRTAPIAAVVAAQTLRGSARLGPFDALTQESLAYSTLQAGPEHRRWLTARGRRTRADADEPRVHVSEDANTVKVMLNRPRLFNLYDAAMRDQLTDVLKALLADDDRSVILTGAGGNFCAGGDPAEFGAAGDPAKAHLIRSRTSAALWLSSLAPRVTASVQGACIGAGVELAAFCATVTADATARFRLPELSMGLIPGAGGTVSIPRRIGRQRTLEWLITNDEVDAETAATWGLIDQVI